jgi:hypothetical protein
MQQENFSPKDSLQLIDTMLNKAKNSYHDTGIGPILWGTVIPFCAIVNYLQIKKVINFPFDVWILTLIAIIPQIFIVIKETKASKAKSYDDTLMNSIWTAFGISIFLFIFINQHILATLEPIYVKYKEVTGTLPEMRYSSYISSFFLLLYGIPTVATGRWRKLPTMFWGGIICWVCCIISVYTPYDVDMLVTAFAAICAWLIPGIILFTRYQKSKKLANV